MVWGFDVVWIVVLYVYSVNSGNGCCSFCVRFCSGRITISGKQRRIQDAAHAACAAVKNITYHDVIIAFRVVKTNTIDFKECSSTSDFWCGTSDNRAAFW